MEAGKDEGSDVAYHSAVAVSRSDSYAICQLAGVQAQSPTRWAKCEAIIKGREDTRQRISGRGPRTDLRTHIQTAKTRSLASTLILARMLLPWLNATMLRP